MNGSIYTGASGLLSFQQALDVESNNVANVNTIGFKSDTVAFDDLMYDQGIGKGTTRDEVLKNFSQGSLVQSDSEYDFALEGDGFFTLQDPETPEKLYYSRTGQFSSNNENYLTNGGDLIVMGVSPVVTGDLITSEYSNNITSTLIEKEDSIYTLNTYTTDYVSNSKELQDVMNNIDIIDADLLAAVDAIEEGTATEEQIELASGKITLIENYRKYSDSIVQLQNGSSGNNYKSIDSTINDIDKTITNYSNALVALSLDPETESEIASKAESTITIPLYDESSDLYTVEILIDGVKIQQEFDESVENTLNLFSDKISQLSGITSSIDIATGELTVSSMITGQNMTLSQAKLNENSLVVTEVSSASGAGQALIDALYADLENALSIIGADVKTNKSEIVDIATGTNVELEPIILDLNTLGLNSTLFEKLTNDGDINNISSYPGLESEDGNLYLTDGNAKFLIGRILPVNFTNVSGLNPEGDNLYTQGVDQKDPIYIEGAATVEGKYLEKSNIDLSETLVNLMVWQKAFDANSKTVMTSDELLQTALALKTS